MSLFKSSILSFIATFVKLVSGFIINKTVAVMVGPTGFAFIGQFQNLMVICLSFAQAGINNGVIKYTAEFSKDKISLKSLWSTSFKFSLMTSFVTSIVLLCFAPFISKLFFSDESFVTILYVFAVTLVFFVLNALVLSIVNGFKRVKVFITINIAQSFVALIFTTFMVYQFGLNGALIALATNQSIVFFLLFAVVKKNKILQFKDFLEPFDKTWLKKLLSYSLMGITSIICAPVAQTLIRKHIGAQIGWDEAGYWQGITYISSTFVTIITAALTLHYLPSLSATMDKQALRTEIMKSFKVMIPITALMAVVIFFMKEIAILLFYNSDFLPMIELFKWQLVGDVIRVASLMLAYVFIAKSYTLEHIISEVLASVIYVGSSFYLIKEFGLVGSTYSYFFTYFLYFFLVFVLLKRRLGRDG